MTTFAVTYRYRGDEVAVEAHRPAHRRYLSGLLADGRLLASGPLGGQGPSGALLLFDASDADEIEDLLAADPFCVADVVADREVRPWTLVFGADRFSRPDI